MWTRLVILLLLLTAASVAENPLEDYQRAVTLHHWEEARDTWSKTDGSLGLLMRVDYHQARNEKDLAWVLLSQVEPRGLNGPEKGYFYLLRANSEYLLYKYELVRRNLAALDAMDEVDNSIALGFFESGHTWRGPDSRTPRVDSRSTSARAEGADGLEHFSSLRPQGRALVRLIDVS